MNKKGLLMSGDCRIGYIGESSNMKDYFGEPLYVGDLVAVSLYDDENPDVYDGFYGVTFIVNNEFQDDGLDKKKFVMGISSDYHEYEDGYGESIVYQNSQKWRVAKVKGFEELVDGEKWGSVRVVFS